METAQQYFQKALDYKNKGDAEKAIEYLSLSIDCFGQLIKDNPKNASLYASRGRIYREVNMSTEAEADLLKAVKLDKKESSYAFYLGELYMSRSLWQKAIEAYRLFFTRENLSRIETTLDYGLAHMNRAIAYNQLYIYDEALRDLEMAEIYSPELPALPANKKIIERNFMDSEIAQYEEVLYANPSDSLARLNMAYLLMEIENYFYAIINYKIILEQQPKNIEALANLGISYCQDKQFQKAIESFDLAKKIDADFKKQEVGKFYLVAKNALKLFKLD